jgi:hypothetical protein
MTDSIEQQLRAHLQRKLKILNGKGQITVRRLVKCIYPKNGTGFKYAEEPSYKNRQSLYAIAAQLCEEAGGKVDMIAYVRSHNGCSVAGRVYQF